MFGYTGYKKSGFTLAEVLITLGIIGVVAAMTIPTLMMNYQKQVWESKLKKAFSVATNACERMLIEENVSRVNETELYGDVSNDTLRKYFKLMQDGTEVSGRGFSILLPDSAVLYINAVDNGFTFYTDVNGLESRPNSAGRDLFEFRLDQNCAYDSSLGESASNEAKYFKTVVENDWKIPDSYTSTSSSNSTTQTQNP
ncbi:type II secretion system protein [bacterium]|nr:type II secretion system protein [bacterium]